MLPAHVNRQVSKVKGIKLPEGLLGGPGGGARLPTGWSWARDGDGQAYFFNRTTGVVTYDDPREVAAPPGAAAASGAPPTPPPASPPVAGAATSPPAGSDAQPSNSPAQPGVATNDLLGLLDGSAKPPSDTDNDVSGGGASGGGGGEGPPTPTGEALLKSSSVMLQEATLIDMGE